MAERFIPTPSGLIPPTDRKFVVVRTGGINFIKGRVIAANIGDIKSKDSRSDVSVRDITQNIPERTKSQLGTSKVGQFIIKTSEDVAIGNDMTSFQNGQGYIVLETALGSISQDRNIIMTPVQGRNGTVKEYISDGDFQISITGKIVDKDNKFPDDQVQDIANVFKAPNEIVIVNSFLYNFDIKNIVVKSYKIEQIEGADNVYNIVIEMVSDDAIELKLGITE